MNSALLERALRREPEPFWFDRDEMSHLGVIVHMSKRLRVTPDSRLAFLSGQVAVTPGHEDVPDDIAGQAKLATASLAAALHDPEATAQDIVMLHVYVVDATSEAFDQAVTPLREMLGDAMPSITTISVQALYKPESRSRSKWWSVSPERGSLQFAAGKT